MSATDPACWSWKLPTEHQVREFNERRLRRARELPDGEEFIRKYLPPDRLRWELMWYWHDDRCAVCGRRCHSRYRHDHDHQTGLFRGLLCASCNIREGISGLEVFVNYRLRNPAVMFNLKTLHAMPTERVREPVPWHLLPDREAA